MTRAVLWIVLAAALGVGATYALVRESESPAEGPGSWYVEEEGPPVSTGREAEGPEPHAPDSTKMPIPIEARGSLPACVEVAPERAWQAAGDATAGAAYLLFHPDEARRLERDPGPPEEPAQDPEPPPRPEVVAPPEDPVLVYPVDGDWILRRVADTLQRHVPLRFKSAAELGAFRRLRLPHPVTADIPAYDLVNLLDPNFGVRALAFEGALYFHLESGLGEGRREPR